MPSLQKQASWNRSPGQSLTFSSVCPLTSTVYPSSRLSRVWTVLLLTWILYAEKKGRSEATAPW